VGPRRGRPLRRVRIDLHIHSTASDGMFSPAEVVARARRGALDVIALADHDTVGGVPDALAVAGEDVRVVPAIEISASHGGRDIHVLGYFIDPAAVGLLHYTQRAAEARTARMHEMIERLATLDVAVEFDAVIAEAGPHVRSLARPHLARVMHAAGHVGSVGEAFERFIGDEGPAFVPARLLDVAGAIQLIHDAGGLAVWAHPSAALFDGLLPLFVEAGLDGVECYRPRLPDADLQRLLRGVRRHELFATGGSDWHGDWHGDLGGFHLDLDRLRHFLERGGLELDES
jgi:3',5'-nucleoside bisphosphate phosphatase